MRRTKRRIHRFSKSAPNSKSIPSLQTKIKKQSEQMILGNTGSCWDWDYLFFFFFFSFCFANLLQRRKREREKSALPLPCGKRKYKRLRGCAENSGLVFDLAGNRDLYTRCSMRAAAISYLQRVLYSNNGTLPLQSVTHSTYYYGSIPHIVGIGFCCTKQNQFPEPLNLALSFYSF
ncbi:hypothetical protein L873DRAFT_609275 [Choiromyces venosus 120613-1]|uniref:Uncharacterized protein n=1 Tax=Choiromyces venosus 120613-1 TaxID=1336337 RepID=A0A3N4K7F8_9PEZI|nr:hypothetical protein L873DRAFT_609275 [Choiromyces venosus 120613-1]